jgi:hypothetical protein
MTAEISKPPIIFVAKRRKFRLPVWLALIGLLIAAGFFVLFVFDPAQHAFYPGCALYRLTGLYCPGCGGLRAVHQLLHGRILAAFHFNPLFVTTVPLLLWAFARAIYRYIHSEPFLPSLKVNWLWSFGVVVILFAIVRNLPFETFAWMRP